MAIVRFTGKFQHQAFAKVGHEDAQAFEALTMAFVASWASLNREGGQHAGSSLERGLQQRPRPSTLLRRRARGSDDDVSHTVPVYES